MKKYLKTFAKIMIALAIIISFCVAVNSKPTHADAGYHSSYSGGSSSSHSSSSSSHSSSSSRSSSYGGSSYSSSGGGGSFAGVVIWVVIVIIIIIITSRKNNTGGMGTIAIPKLQSNQTAIAKLKQLFPDFDEKAFLQNGYDMFLKVEDAWMNFDLEKVHNIITDEMFNMYESQLSSMEIKGEQNIMNGFDLKDCAISSCREQNDTVEVTAKYIIEFYDYIIDKESGNVLRGNKSRKLRMYYDFTFVASKSQKKIDKCPNCGAPVEVNSVGVCPYCNSKIIGENTEWVMSKKVCTNQVNL